MTPGDDIVNSKRKLVIILLTLALVMLTIWTSWSNKALEINTYQIKSEKLSDSFDLFRIAQISDLHNNTIGKDNNKLISELESANPDIIAITGDLIDSRTTNVDITVEFIEKAVEIAPCYYVNGNHESRVPNEYETLKNKLVNLGVTILENESVEIERESNTINLIGINDPDFYAEDSITITDTNINSLDNDRKNFTVLLSHRPEIFDVYVKNGIDLVLSGHAHGGQFRLPFIGGLFAPHQGAFPEYDSGLYSQNNTSMIVSRGIGNSMFPFRFNNRPEIILIELKAIR